MEKIKLDKSQKEMLTAQVLTSRMFSDNLSGTVVILDVNNKIVN